MHHLFNRTLKTDIINWIVSLFKSVQSITKEGVFAFTVYKVSSTYNVFMPRIFFL